MGVVQQVPYLQVSVPLADNDRGPEGEREKEAH